MTIEAKVIADSIANGVRLTTMELKFHRFILPEFNTHRMFSRNASSSRAIPIEKMLEQVKAEPSIPIHWGKNQPGMQAREEIDHIETAKYRWTLAAEQAVLYATKLNSMQLHKQVVNRLLEPFQYIKVIVTATEWDNFFKLRLHPDAQPEIAFLASKMQEAMNNSVPEKLEHGEWHLPYVDRNEFQINGTYSGLPYIEIDYTRAIKCSVARCARVSYLNHDNTNPDIEKDIALYDRLLKDGHMSPFEHVATPIKTPNYDGFSSKFWEKGVTHTDRNDNFWSGNFKSWLQYRQMI